MCKIQLSRCYFGPILGAKEQTAHLDKQLLFRFPKTQQKNVSHKLAKLATKLPPYQPSILMEL